MSLPLPRRRPCVGRDQQHDQRHRIHRVEVNVASLELHRDVNELCQHMPDRAFLLLDEPWSSTPFASAGACLDATAQVRPAQVKSIRCI
jgi:hypothetical protein